MRGVPAQRLTAPEAVAWLPHCLRSSQSALVSGPRLVRRFVNVALSAWELDCHASLTGKLQVSHHLRLSVSDRQTPVLTPLSGT